jgi:hypothetical protein
MAAFFGHKKTASQLSEAANKLSPRLLWDLQRLQPVQAS